MNAVTTKAYLKKTSYKAYYSKKMRRGGKGDCWFCFRPNGDPVKVTHMVPVREGGFPALSERPPRFPDLQFVGLVGPLCTFRPFLIANELLARLAKGESLFSINDVATLSNTARYQGIPVGDVHDFFERHREIVFRIERLACPHCGGLNYPPSAARAFRPFLCLGCNTYFRPAEGEPYVCYDLPENRRQEFMQILCEI